MPESRDEQVDVLGALSVLGEGALSEGDGAHPCNRDVTALPPGVTLSLPAPVPVPESLRRAVSPPEPRPLRQDELQLWSGSSSYQGPDQGQRVLVEVSLK